MAGPVHTNTASRHTRPTLETDQLKWITSWARQVPGMDGGSWRVEQHASCETRRACSHEHVSFIYIHTNTTPKVACLCVSISMHAHKYRCTIPPLPLIPRLFFRQFHPAFSLFSPFFKVFESLHYTSAEHLKAFHLNTPIGTHTLFRSPLCERQGRGVSLFPVDSCSPCLFHISAYPVVPVFLFIKYSKDLLQKQILVSGIMSLSEMASSLPACSSISSALPETVCS